MKYLVFILLALSLTNFINNQVADAMMEANKIILIGPHDIRITIKE